MRWGTARVLAGALVVAGCGAAGEPAGTPSTGTPSPVVERAEATVTPDEQVTDASPAPTPAAAGATTVGTDATDASVASIDAPARTSVPAERVARPVIVDWIGGSDVAWEDVSVPEATDAALSAPRSDLVTFRVTTEIAAMPVDVEAMLRRAVAAGTDAIVMSVNPVWVHWDGASCDGVEPPHARYACLLRSSSAAVDARRAEELASLLDAAAASGLPVYVYVSPHSTDVLADPEIDGLVRAAEGAIATADPGSTSVRLWPEVFNRDLPPMYEGSEFRDMVHPTPAGASALAPWFAADLEAFWDELGFATAP